MGLDRARIEEAESIAFSQSAHPLHVRIPARACASTFEYILCNILLWLLQSYSFQQPDLVIKNTGTLPVSEWVRISCEWHEGTMVHQSLSQTMRGIMAMARPLAAGDG